MRMCRSGSGAIQLFPDGSGRVTVGSNQEARADAIKRVPEWFAR